MPPITLPALLPMTLLTFLTWRIINPLPSTSSSRQHPHSRFAVAAPDAAARLRGDAPVERKLSMGMGNPTSAIMAGIMARGKSGSGAGNVKRTTGGGGGHRRNGSAPGRIQQHQRRGETWRGKVGMEG
ncbi:hypothetical protein K440DRAFT_194468 [Wilcoxina mikolae CBS 423.85]|nr:hypothetical protein K440DRAFT_194468 [Wilcoxina mikolae CBS 423.85]